MQLDVSFENWKRLTTLLVDESDSYDAVIARLIASFSSDALQNSEAKLLAPSAQATGAFFKGVFLPDGTQLRATYKGKTYFAIIQDSQWLDLETGEARNSPSEAAYNITKSGVNGWRFWTVQRPNDLDWRPLDSLRGEIR